MRKRNKANKPAADAATVETTSAPVIATKPQSFGGFSIGNINRTAATIARSATHYGTTSDRDGAYAALFVTVADTLPAGQPVKLGDLAEYCGRDLPAGQRARNPFYSGSAKPHDAGAINRAERAGSIVKASDGASFTLTDAGRQLGLNTLRKLAEAAQPVPAAPAADNADNADNAQPAAS